jgi:MauM/NapG family ferredoxin protein
MSDRDFTRRAFLLGRPRTADARSGVAPASQSITKDGRSLPSVISWLDPEMRATERRGVEGDAFPLLRPPGAVSEHAFLEACTRCGDCARACPHDAIRAAPERLRDAGGTPVIDPVAAPCQMCEDLPCITSCETGALRSEAPAALGSARVQPLDCLNRLSSTCNACIEHCPVPGALAFAGDVPAVNESLCTGCGICQHVCPAPQNAILMLPNLGRPTPAQLDAAATVVATAAAESRESIDLPELHEGALDDAGLRSLFRDLQTLADIDEIRVKRGAERRAGEGAPSLRDALGLLLGGQVRGVQIRYRYRGESWCDTVLAAPGGHRVVRMAEPTRPAGIS